MDWQTLEHSLSEALDCRFTVRAARAVSGGCINETFCLEDGRQRVFAKVNHAHKEDLFVAEAASLTAIREAGAITAPRPLCIGSDGAHSWLVMEFLALESQSSGGEAQLGEHLAELHRHCGDTYGFQHDNYIGETRQPNDRTTDWCHFFREQRLGVQLDLARQNGAPGRLIDCGRRLQCEVHAFFTDYRPEPSLLHGDLWNGNTGYIAKGEPVIFDPAAYFGDREADLAMTELFGGFSERFYQSYRQSWSLDPGYETRKVLYNLYHILNHYNLFGDGYAEQAQGMIDRLLAALS